MTNCVRANELKLDTALRSLPTRVPTLAGTIRPPPQLQQPLLSPSISPEPLLLCGVIFNIHSILLQLLAVQISVYFMVMILILSLIQFN